MTVLPTAISYAILSGWCRGWLCRPTKPLPLPAVLTRAVDALGLDRAEVRTPAAAAPCSAPAPAAVSLLPCPCPCCPAAAAPVPAAPAAAAVPQLPCLSCPLLPLLPLLPLSCFGAPRRAPATVP